MSKPEKVAIGIDLGTTCCTIGVYHNGKLEIITNEQGNRTTPSVVAFTDKGRLVGDKAQAQEETNPENTIYDVKKMMGKKYNDKDVKKNMKKWPFKVVEEQGQPKVEVNCNNKEERFTPEEISSIMLVKMKQIAEKFLGRPVEDAVITVPAHFNEDQRQATIDAAAIAGLNILRIINEPTAAAMAYNFDECAERYILVYRLGAGTFDVSVFAIQDGKCNLRASVGDPHLGGRDFDATLVNHFVREFLDKHGIDLTLNRQNMRNLERACEAVKKNLSTNCCADIKVSNLVDGCDFRLSISRQKFEELNAVLFEITLAAVEQVLNDANIPKEKINDIILVGGSTKIPKIQRLLREFFDGKELNQTVNPMEAPAMGAALQAAALVGCGPSIMRDTLLLRLAPLSTGIETAGGLMAVLVPRNTPMPCCCTHEFSTYSDNQSSVLIQVFQGERPMTRDNRHLGDIVLSGLPPAPRGIPKIEVTFSIDAEGCLNVTAEEKAVGKKSEMTISKESGQVPKAEVDRLVEESKKFKEEDEKKKSAVQAGKSLECICSDIFYPSKPLPDDGRKRPSEGVKKDIKPSISPKDIFPKEIPTEKKKKRDKEKAKAIPSSDTSPDVTDGTEDVSPEEFPTEKRKKKGKEKAKAIPSSDSSPEAATTATDVTDVSDATPEEVPTERKKSKDKEKPKATSLSDASPGDTTGASDAAPEVPTERKMSKDKEKPKDPKPSDSSPGDVTNGTNAIPEVPTERKMSKDKEKPKDSKPSDSSPGDTTDGTDVTPEEVPPEKKKRKEKVRPICTCDLKDTSGDSSDPTDSTEQTDSSDRSKDRNSKGGK